MVAVHVFDDILDAESHRMTWEFLSEPGWQFGAYSDADGERYHYKHFAGYSATGTEDRDHEGIADELHANCAGLYRMWCGIEQSILPDHLLSRCYANRMAPGVGGGLHRDSFEPGHVTAIYYPGLAWSPRDGGETLFFDNDERDVIQAVAPLPNRLIVFPGTIPHVARPRSLRSEGDRITLVFKTLGRRSAIVVPPG